MGSDPKTSVVNRYGRVDAPTSSSSAARPSVASAFNPTLTIQACTASADASWAATKDPVAAVAPASSRFVIVSIGLPPAFGRGRPDCSREGEVVEPVSVRQRDKAQRRDRGCREKPKPNSSASAGAPRSRPH
jgi:hypothetical protein